MKIKMTLDTFNNLDNASEGVCTHCCAIKECVEPDAQRYECEECGQHGVYGVQYLLICGRITVVADDSNANVAA